MDLTDDETRQLSTYYEDNTITDIQIFKRLYKDGETFYCEHYTKVKKRNSFTIIYGPGQNYGQLQYFAIHQGKPTAVVRRLSRQEGSSYLVPIVPVIITTELVIIDIKQIKEKVIFISTSPSTSYIACFPNSLNLD